MKLSKRLQQVAELVPSGVTVADIGSDHAYLPIYLVQQGRVEKAIAGEVNQGPFETAIRSVDEAGLVERIDVRKGNGLEVLRIGEVGVITIAGMGGGTIVDILAADTEKLAGVRRLILQPMVDGDQLRSWLHQNGWRIVKEDLVVDDQILYEILAAEPGIERYEDPLWYEIGNPELVGQHLLFSMRVRSVMERIDRVLQRLEQAKTAAAISKKQDLLQKKRRLEEVLQACN